MKSGTEIEVDGGADVGRRITVWDPEVDEIEIRWKNIRTIELFAGARRSRGRRRPSLRDRRDLGR